MNHQGRSEADGQLCRPEPTTKTLSRDQVASVRSGDLKGKTTIIRTPGTNPGERGRYHRQHTNIDQGENVATSWGRGHFSRPAEIHEMETAWSDSGIPQAHAPDRVKNGSAELLQERAE